MFNFNSDKKAEPADVSARYRANVSKKVFKATCAFLFLCAVGVLSFVAYSKYSSSLNGMGGSETWGNTAAIQNIEQIVPAEDLSVANAGYGNTAEAEVVAANSGAEMSMPAKTNVTAENSNPAFLTYFSYRVKQGDMISVLAEKFGITQDTIISMNNIKQSRLIQIGQFLKIPSMTGVLYTVKKDGETVNSIVEKYNDISAEKCANINGLALNVSLPAGKTIFVPDAVLDWATKQEINGDLFIKPLRSGYRLTSYYGWRKSPFSGARSYHSGVDMATSHGTSVYAALNGKVTFAGFNSTYGNYVIITHHSGYQSLYGHMSAILVTQGQYVDSNTRIGRVGSTGLSTGPHLHFTVMKNGKTMNPMALWQ